MNVAVKSYHCMCTRIYVYAYLLIYFLIFCFVQAQRHMRYAHDCQDVGGEAPSLHALGAWQTQLLLCNMTLTLLTRLSVQGQ